MPVRALERLVTFLLPVLPTPERVTVAAAPTARTPGLAGAPPAADEYSDYHGPPISFTWLSVEGLDLPINVHLTHVPSEEAARALERTIAAWYWAGSRGAFSSGGFHSVDGPNWSDRVVRWSVDTGRTDVEAALAQLMRRLAGWSARFGCEIEAVQIGYEEP